MRIASVASAFPQHYYSQQMLLEALQEYWGDKIENPNVLRRLHRQVSVDGRFLSLPKEEYLKMKTWGEANHHWIRTAKELGEKAVAGALTGAGLTGRNLGAFFFVSVTGISSPSIDALLINQMGLCREHSPDSGFRAGMRGWGGGHFPRRRLCAGLSGSGGGGAFGGTVFPDAAARGRFDGESDFRRAVRRRRGGRDCGGNGLRTLRSQHPGDAVGFYSDTEEMMGWDVSERGFRIVLSRDIPDLVRHNLARDVDEFLAQQGLTRAEIGRWVLHTGGPKILEATAEALGLQNGELEVSWQCLRRTGNLSSASVLVVLEEVMKNRRPESGTYGLLAAMGPGFCAEFVLLQW